jgi:protein-tyrosine phosphatase
MKITTDISNLNNTEIVDPYEELLANGIIYRLDINFITDLKFNKMGNYPIYIGPYPQNEQEISVLAETGITAVLNVQTEKDQKHRQIDWAEHIKAYKHSGIEVARVQIEDFNQEDLILKLRSAGDRLHELISDNKVVYVHCTAGMSRAAATVIIYLVFYQNYTLDDAYDFVKSHREIICPNVRAIEKVISENEGFY